MVRVCSGESGGEVMLGSRTEVIITWGTAYVLWITATASARVLGEVIVTPERTLLLVSDWFGGQDIGQLVQDLLCFELIRQD